MSLDFSFLIPYLPQLAAAARFTLTIGVFSFVLALARSHMTLVLVTHQMNMVKNFAARVLFLENGAIFFDGTFDALTAAADPRIRQFLKKIYP
jgi:ABC-type polar amino acid transport system ATPase subunit